MSSEYKTTAEEKNDLFALFDSELLGSLEATVVRKGCIELNISRNISLLLTLEPIPKPNEGKEVCHVSNDSGLVVGTSHERSDGEDEIQSENRYMKIDIKDDIKVVMIEEMKDDMKMDTGEMEDLEGVNLPDVKWIQDLFSCSMMKAQLLLLEHWSSSKQAEAENEKLQNATAAAARLASELKMRPVVTSKISSTPLTNVALPSSTQPPDSKIESKVHPSDTYSQSLSGIDVLKRLINPVLRSKVRDVGDGIAATLNRTFSGTSIGR